MLLEAFPSEGWPAPWGPVAPEWSGTADRRPTSGSSVMPATAPPVNGSLDPALAETVSALVVSGYSSDESLRGSLRRWIRTRACGIDRESEIRPSLSRTIDRRECQGATRRVANYADSTQYAELRGPAPSSRTACCPSARPSHGHSDPPAGPVAAGPLSPDALVASRSTYIVRYTGSTVGVHGTIE